MNDQIAHYDIVVVGAGIAGVTAAATALATDAAVRVLLLNGETWAPYDRPPLSKDVLLGRMQPGDFPLLTAATSGDPRLTALAGVPVAGIDRAAKVLELADGRRFGYGRLILATGARPRRLEPAVARQRVADGVIYLRSMDDAIRLKAALEAGSASPRLAVIGAGYIGLEVAAAARGRGCPVTVLEAGDRVLARNAPAVVGDFVCRRHQDRGVAFRFGAGVAGIERAAAGYSIALGDGEMLEADVVVAGIGSLPNDELARASGLACDNGILVDAGCRTDDAAIFAVGDAVRLRPGDGGPATRIEHWNAARIMGEVAGANACGDQRVFAAVPWVWSDQYEMNLQFVGRTGGNGRRLLRGDPAGGKWAVLEMDGDTLVGATLINLGKERRLLEQIIRDRLTVDEGGLADAKVALKTLLPAGVR